MHHTSTTHIFPGDCAMHRYRIDAVDTAGQAMPAGDLPVPAVG